MFGLSPSRIRGTIALLLVLLMFYLFIFESDPPPLFSEVQVTIPDPPEVDFDERTIVLPEFEASPLLDEDAPADDVVAIVPAQATPTLAIEPAAEPASAVEPEPAAEAAPVAAAAPAVEPEPEPAPALEATAAPVVRSIIDQAPDGFFVQVGAFKSQEAAAELLERLQAQLKVSGYIQTIQRDNNRLYRVRLGSFGDDEAQAREVISRLRQYDVALSESAFVDEI